jgi:hypothetical protein
MGLIRLDKQYENLYVAGCSFTTGHIEGRKASWGTHLAKKLNCKCIINGINSNSNYHMMLGVINLCESNDMSNSCVGIQLTERSRRELWLMDQSTYYTFNYATLDLNDINTMPNELKFFKKNLSDIETIYFDDRENLLRTITSITMLKNYFENKNIDYIFFEGISTIKDEIANIDSVKMPNVLGKKYRDSLLNDSTFFSKYGPMQPFDRTHPLFDFEKNGGHPNSEFVEWWVEEMYEHIKTNQ